MRSKIERVAVTIVCTVLGGLFLWKTGCLGKANSFLAPGGAPYDPARTVAAQSGQPFGCRSALLFLAHRGASRAAQLDLNEILTVPDLNRVEWVRSSKVRTAEALFLERLWTVTRELLPPAGLYE